MKKAELKTALEEKFDKVGNWEGGFPPLLGMSRYDIKVYNYGENVRTYTVYVEGDGGAGEVAHFVGANPTEEKPVAELSFLAIVETEIETKKTSGAIVDGYVDKMTLGNTVTEVVVYRDVSGAIVRERYIIHQKADKTLLFRKIS